MKTLIKLFGGKPNGTGNTWIFKTGSIISTILLVATVFFSIGSFVYNIHGLPNIVADQKQEIDLMKKDNSDTKIVIVDVKAEIKNIGNKIDILDANNSKRMDLLQNSVQSIQGYLMDKH